MTTQIEFERKNNDDIGEIWVSRVDPNVCNQEEKAYNVEPPTRTTTTQLEASHCMITKGLIATVEKATNTTESEKNRLLFSRKLQRVLGVRIVAVPTRKNRNIRPLMSFVKKRDWEAIKTSNGQ